MKRNSHEPIRQLAEKLNEVNARTGHLGCTALLAFVETRHYRNESGKITRSLMQ